MKKIINVFVLCLLSQLTFSQANSDSVKTVTLGTQVWMQENLSVTNFKNGEAIPIAKNAKEWQEAYKLKKPMCAYYEFNEANAATLGLYYNWYAVNDPRGLAPEGFHVPVTDEWKKLQEYLYETFKVDDPKVVKKQKTWKGSKATNETSLSFIGNGLMDYTGVGRYKNTHMYLWTANPLTPKNEGFHVYLTPDSERFLYGFNLDLTNGMAVRCIKNK